MTTKASKNILLIALDRWVHTCRLPKAFCDAGFEVTVCAVKNDPLHASKFAHKTIIIPSGMKSQTQLLSFIGEACLANKTDFILPCDESAIHTLTLLYENICESEEEAKQELTKLIEKSRGNPRYYRASYNKVLTTKLADEIGIRIPEEKLCENNDDAIYFAAQQGFPIVLKSEIGTAGTQVHICHSEKEIKENIKKLNPKNAHIAQQFIDGKPAMFNACAIEGKVIASAIFKKVECYPDSKGPSAVVELIDHKEIKRAGEKFVSHINYSGIISLDFMLDQKNKAYLIECNPRPTPVSHLGHVTGNDLAAGLMASLKGKNYKPQKPIAKTVALFPKELARDNKSEYLYNSYHDVPWDQPELVAFLLNTLRR